MEILAILPYILLSQQEADGISDKSSGKSVM